MRYQDLIKEIKQKNFHPVYFFTGPEEYIADMMEKRLTAAVITPETAQLNLMRFSGKDTSMNDVIALCEQFPIMSPFRMVVINAETDLLNTKNEKEIEQFEKYIKNPSPSTILLLKSPHPDKRKKLIKNLISAAAVVEYTKLNRIELEKWLAARLKKAGKTIGRKALDAFITRSRYLENDDQNMAAIDNEINKLIDFCGNRPEITVNDIEITLPPSIDENIYHMIDYFMSGNTAEALQMLHHFYLNGQDPIGVFALIISQMRTLLQIQILSLQKKLPQEIASEVHRPLFVVKKLLQTAKKFPRNTLFEIIDSAALLDWQIKNGTAEAAPAVELFLIKMTHRSVTN